MFVLASWAAVAGAGTVCPVGCDFPTLRDAVLSVPDPGADTFVVTGGAYVEAGPVVVTGDRSVEFVANGAVTVSNGGNTPVMLVDGTSARLTVRGMSLTAFNQRALEVRNGGWALLDDDVVYTLGLKSQGGAVLVDGATLEAQQTLFLDNVATSGGGHVAAIGAELVFTDCTFIGGFARRGGALLLTGTETAPARASLVRGRFDDNLAAEAGGAILLTGWAELDVQGTVFQGNAAEIGGVLADEGGGQVTAVVREALFVDNRADGPGGVVASTGATWTFEDDRFEGNAAQEGGALWIDGGSASLVRNLLCANTASRGGAVWSRTDAPQVWSNNRMIENLAAIGGAVDHGTGPLLLQHTNLFGNAADLGGAVFSESTVELRNSVVAYTEGSTAVIGGPVIAAYNAWWLNVAGDLLGGAEVGEEVRDVFADPRLERYQVGTGCAAADDFYSWYGPLRDGAEPAARDPDGSPGDLGAYGGAAAAAAPWSGDIDGDGYPPLYDCVEGDAEVHPLAPDAPYDGIDQDCDRRDDYDRDGDGYRVEIDCDDNDPRVHPGATDRPGEDRDCDEGVDVDGDGYSPPLDCDDEDPRIHPGAVEDLDPTVDLDCTPPADVTRPLEPRTCSTGRGMAAGLAIQAVVAGAVARRRRRGGAGFDRRTRTGADPIEPEPDRDDARDGRRTRGHLSR